MKLNKRKLNNLIKDLKKSGGKVSYPYLHLIDVEEKYLKENGVNVIYTTTQLPHFLVEGTYEHSTIVLELA